MFIRLTRQAEKATTTSVSSTPIAYATTRLGGLTAYAIVELARRSANALAITSTIPYATAMPTSAPTAAASRS